MPSAPHNKYTSASRTPTLPQPSAGGAPNSPAPSVSFGDQRPEGGNGGPPLPAPLEAASSREFPGARPSKSRAPVARGPGPSRSRDAGNPCGGGATPLSFGEQPNRLPLTLSTASNWMEWALSRTCAATPDRLLTPSGRQAPTHREGAGSWGHPRPKAGGGRAGGDTARRRRRQPAHDSGPLTLPPASARASGWPWASGKACAATPDRLLTTLRPSVAPRIRRGQGSWGHPRPKAGGGWMFWTLRDICVRHPGLEHEPPAMHVDNPVQDVQPQRPRPTTRARRPLTAPDGGPPRPKAGGGREGGWTPAAGATHPHTTTAATTDPGRLRKTRWPPRAKPAILGA